MDQKSPLLLKEQLCFPVYAVSRLITRLYQPYLQRINLTYPQYLVMLVLWENSPLSVGQLGEKLYLNTNTLTPLIKKLMDKKLVSKTRSLSDERSVLVEITPEGLLLKQDAENIPTDMVGSLDMEVDDLLKMRELMWKFLATFDNEADV